MTPQAPQRSSTQDLTSRTADSINQHSDLATLFDHQNPSLDAYDRKQKQKDIPTCQLRQQETNISSRSPSISRSNVKTDLLNTADVTEVDWSGLTNISENNSPIHFDDSNWLDVQQYSLERHHHKELLQYTHEFKCDLQEGNQEQERHVSSKVMNTSRMSDEDSATDIQYDTVVWPPQSSERYSEPDHEPTDPSTDIIPLLCNPSLAPMEPAQSSHFKEYVTQQQWWKCLPHPFGEYTNSSRSSAARSNSIHKRVKRCAGTASCPSETSGEESDDVDGMGMIGEEALEELG